MIDPNLIRWINASVNQFFTANKSPYLLYIYGQEFNFKNNNGSDAESWAELHLLGPDIDEATSGEYLVDLDLTIMCSAVPTSDGYLLHRIAGKFLGLASGDIDVFRYGDDNVKIGCLRPVQKARVVPWGVVQASKGPVRVSQQSIEQKYHMAL